MKDIRHVIGKEEMWNKLDNQLLDAAFAPAIKEKFVYEDLIYKSPHDFLQQLYKLSEYYMTINPVLSSGLWGIWNTLDYMSRGRTKRINDKELLQHYKALVATAVLQFADSDADCYVSLNYAEKEELEKYVATAIDDIEKLPNWNDVS